MAPERKSRPFPASSRRCWWVYKSANTSTGHNISFCASFSPSKIMWTLFDATHHLWRTTRERRSSSSPPRAFVLIVDILFKSVAERDHALALWAPCARHVADHEPSAHARRRSRGAHPKKCCVCVSTHDPFCPLSLFFLLFLAVDDAFVRAPDAGTDVSSLELSF